MPDTPTSDDAPLRPELRVTVTIPLPTEPFAQAKILAQAQPHIEACTTALDGISDATVDSRVVQPVRRKAKAPPSGIAAILTPSVLAAALAPLLLAACGVATTEPDCVREHPTCMVVESLDAGAGDDGAEGGAQ